ncbi:MAG: DNA sulfur modification protein DndD [Gracilimonas sp.]
MILNKLFIENFGVYAGSHEFDLSVNTKYEGSEENVIIVKGPNGSGKSTFFKAIGLGIFGRKYLSSRISNKEYDEFILNRIHKNKFSGANDYATTASIKLELKYVESGITHDLVIDRTWNRSGDNVSEKLDILVDGNKPQVTKQDYETWLMDIFPVGMKTILSFDAENMNSLIRSKNDDELQNMLKRLLGLNLVEQLKEDLNYYLRKNGGGNQYSLLQDEVLSSQKELDNKKKELASEQDNFDSLENNKAELLEELEKFENKLSSMGGDYAARRPIFKQRIKDLEEDIERISNRIRELATGLLPFIFAPELIEKLIGTLEEELDLKRKAIASDYVDKKLDELAKSDIWDKFNISSDKSKEMLKALSNTIQSKDKSVKKIHDLAENEVIKLKSWANEVQNSIPEMTKNLAEDLNEKKNKRKELLEYLDRVPDEESIEPTVKKIKSIEKSLREADAKIETSIKNISKLEYEYNMLFSNHEKITEKLHSTQKNNRAFSLAEKSKKVLLDYHTSLANKKVSELADELKNCFNQICDKDQLLKDVQIDAEKFEVKLVDHRNEVQTMDDLSAGESQIYGISLLWALRKISGYELPLLIDTPIARLDEIHRSNLIHKYIPEVSKQVLLFTTNVELNNEVEAEFEPITSKKYDLNFLKEKGHTKVKGEGYNLLSKEVAAA